jgi:hypothetical protein
MSLYLVILFKQLYMFRAFLVHPQEFLHSMVSRSLWQMCGCVVVWFGLVMRLLYLRTNYHHQYSHTNIFCPKNLLI